MQQNGKWGKRTEGKPSYAKKAAQPKRPAAAPRAFKTAEAPEGSENWARPWVQLKYFTYNPAVFPRMLGAVSPDAVAGGLINVYDKNGEPFGGGFWNPQSRTPLRMLYHGPEQLTEKDLEAALVRRTGRFDSGPLCGRAEPGGDHAGRVAAPAALAAHAAQAVRHHAPRHHGG